MRFATKRLTRSDLTFFEYQFRRQNAGNQKSINLNRNVFVDLLFPLAASMTGGVARQFPVPVSIYGPGLRAARHLITRKVIAAGGSQKNWRLNGEFVPDPDDDPTRYHGLAEGDLAVFGFEGDNGVPTAVNLVLLAQSEADDAGPFGEVAGVLGTRSMADLPADAFSGIVERSPAGHPIRELLEASTFRASHDGGCSRKGARSGGSSRAQRRTLGHAVSPPLA